MSMGRRERWAGIEASRGLWLAARARRVVSLFQRRRGASQSQCGYAASRAREVAERIIGSGSRGLYLMAMPGM
jgi:hypothetical protein